MRISSYLEDIFRSAVNIFRTLYHTCAVMETWEVRVTWAALTWSGDYTEVHRSSAAALFWTDIKVHVCSHMHLQLVSCKCINNLVFGFVTWIIFVILSFIHTHTYCVLYTVPCSSRTWQLLVYEGRAEQSFSLGIRICVPTPLRISWRNQGAGKAKAQVFWLLYHCCGGVCVFSSASAFVMHTRTCYTLQLWFHGRPCLFVRASWEIRETRGTFNVGVHYLYFFVQFHDRKVEEGETKLMRKKRVNVKKDKQNV